MLFLYNKLKWVWSDLANVMGNTRCVIFKIESLCNKRILLFLQNSTLSQYQRWQHLRHYKFADVMRSTLFFVACTGSMCYVNFDNPASGLCFMIFISQLYFHIHFRFEEVKSLF